MREVERTAAAEKVAAAVEKVAAEAFAAAEAVVADDADDEAAEAAIAAMAEGEDDAPRPSVAALRASFAEAGASPLTPEQIPTRASWSSAGRWQSRVSAGASAGVGAVATLKPVPRSSSFGRSTMSAPDSAAGGVSALKAKFAGNSAQVSSRSSQRARSSRPQVPGKLNGAVTGLRPGSGLHRHLLQAGAER